MKTTMILTLLIGWFTAAESAVEPTTIDLGFTPEFIDFSPDDRYLVAENENQYLVWDIETNSKVLEGKYAFKIGRSVKSISIPTGSGYFLFGNEAVFMTVDYQHNKADIKAFDLNDGSLIWETDQLDMGVSWAETVISAHAGGVLDVEVNGAKLPGVHRANNFFTRDRFLDRLINYIPAISAIALNGKDGLQLVDVRNGSVRWTQAEVKGGIGELLVDAAAERLFAVTVPATEGALDLLTTTPSVIGLDAHSGKLLWEVEYTGDFVPGYATIAGNTLVLPYLGLAFIDLQTGTERVGDVKRSMAAATNVTKGLGGLMALDKAMGGSFGASADAPSKYNRLVPRRLHFNDAGKLCYFTMFNKDGKWGTGGKKGYTVIDIHQDKIEVAEYALLDNQWTVMQDEMVDGVFYVKARGNMNRTIIKAIDARTGKALFETEKAKNSADIAKQFNPFMIDAVNSRFIDVASKDVYVFDAKTGEKIGHTATKDLGVGTVEFSEFSPNGLLVFGTKGVGIMDVKGNVVANVPTKNLKGFAASDREVWLLEYKKFTRIDAVTGEVLETLPLNKTELIAFSASGKVLARNKGNQVEIFR